MNIGVTGRLGTGKDVFGDFLAEAGFHKISLSDLIRDDLRKRDVPITRDALNKHGSILRREHGNAVLARRAKEDMEGDDNVFVSIRHPAEVQELSTLDSFTLVAVTASRAQRLERLRRRDSMTEEELQRYDAEEQGDAAWLRTDEVISMADYVIENDGSMEELREKAKDLVHDISR